MSSEEEKPQPPFDDKERLHWELTKDLSSGTLQTARVSQTVKRIITESASWEDFDLGMQIAMKSQRDMLELNQLLYVKVQAERLKKSG